MSDKWMFGLISGCLADKRTPPYRKYTSFHAPARGLTRLERSIFPVGQLAVAGAKKHPVRRCPGKDEQYALYLKLPFVTGNYVESDCCPKCKRIIIDSTGYENNLR